MAAALEPFRAIVIPRAFDRADRALIELNAKVTRARGVIVARLARGERRSAGAAAIVAIGMAEESAWAVLMCCTWKGAEPSDAAT